MGKTDKQGGLSTWFCALRPVAASNRLELYLEEASGRALVESRANRTEGTSGREMIDQWRMGATDREKSTENKSQRAARQIGPPVAGP